MAPGWIYYGVAVLTAGAGLFPIAATVLAVHPSSPSYGKQLAIRRAFGIDAAVACTAFLILEIATWRKYDETVEPFYSIVLLSLIAGVAIAKWRDDGKFAPFAAGAVALWIFVAGLAWLAVLHYPEPASSILFFRVMPVYVTAVVAATVASAVRQFRRQAFPRTKTGT